MRTSRLFARSSALLALPLFACATLFAACGGDDSSGATTDAGGTTDSSQGDTGTTDTGPGVDAAHDSATLDSAADASTDSSTTTDAPASDGNAADGEAGEAAAPSTVVPCDPGTIATMSVAVGGAGDNFAPANITINVGDTVQWTWGASFHSVSSVANSTSCTPDGEFCSPSDTNCSAGTLSNLGATYCQKFTAAGTFNYVCFQHCGEGMRGSVIVQ